MHTSLPSPELFQPRQCKSHNVSKCIADPTHLFRVRCTRCEFTRDYSPAGTGAAKYLYYRRRTRSSLGLLSVSAPLDPASAAYLCRTASECGIISNTAAPSVSFVEGLEPEVDHGYGVRSLRAALSYDPTLTIVGFHRVPRRDNVTDLIIANVVLSPGADYAARQLSGNAETCLLPQFPTHVALGACPRAGGGSKRAMAWAEASLRGVTLAVDPRRVRVLPPPDGGNKSKRRQQIPHRQQIQGQQVHRRSQPRQQVQQQQQQHHHQPRVVEEQLSHGLSEIYPTKLERSLSDLTDDTDMASTSGSSTTSPSDNEEQFPGLTVDLTFLDFP